MLTAQELDARRRRERRSLILRLVGSVFAVGAFLFLLHLLGLAIQAFGRLCGA